jgi:hypothetical protein
MPPMVRKGSEGAFFPANGGASGGVRRAVTASIQQFRHCFARDSTERLSSPAVDASSIDALGACAQLLPRGSADV